MKSKFFHLLFIGFLVLFSPKLSLAASFGMSPPEIINKSLKPGSDFVYVVELSTNDPSEDRKIQVEVLGDDEIKDWVQIKTSDLYMPKGESRFPLHVQLKVPEDAKEGDYKGRVSVVMTSVERGSEPITLKLGGFINLSLAVIDENVTDYLVKNIFVDDLNVGDNLSLNLKIKNNGNTLLKKVDTQVSILNPIDSKVLKKLSSKKLSKSIPPHVTDFTKLSFKVGTLGAGQYKLVVRSKNSDDSWYENQMSLVVRDPNAKLIKKPVASYAQVEPTLSSEPDSTTFVESLYHFLLGPWFLFGSIFIVFFVSYFITHTRH